MPPLIIPYHMLISSRSIPTVPSHFSSQNIHYQCFCISMSLYVASFLPEVPQTPLWEQQQGRESPHGLMRCCRGWHQTLHWVKVLWTNKHSYGRFFFFPNPGLLPISSCLEFLLLEMVLASSWGVNMFWYRDPIKLCPGLWK